MSLSIFTRAAFAAGLLASTASAAFNGAAKTNVAMYWGQGANQIPLSEVCTDPSIDIVNIGFVNKFPKKRGEYPGTNHANACGASWYIDPTTNEPSSLLSSCPGVGEAITACQKSGKKVMLSLGGGYPTDYYLPTVDVANWFAEFLLGAYGPLTEEWKAGNKPRPFGDAVIDGFDLDLEAAEYQMPSAEYLYKNYDAFGTYVKEHSDMYLSGAPQCVVPDARIFEALQKVPFDFLFTQFYNTWDCSAAKAVADIKGNKASTFTFETWATWLKQNSLNPDIKLYLGLAAGEDGLPSHKDHYLKPEDANLLVEKFKGNSLFGGVMLWEATVSKRNPTYGQSYGAWIKYAVQGTFKKNYHPVVSSSTKVSSSTTTPKTSSTLVSSTKISSSTPVSSTMETSSKASSSAYVTSSVASSSFHEIPSLSSVETVSSTFIESSLTATISASASSSTSVYVPLPTESASSTETASSSFIEASSILTISASETMLPIESSSLAETISSTFIEPSSILTISASETHMPTESLTSVETVSSTFIEPSSIFTISAPETASSSVYVPYPSETPIYSSSSDALSSTSCSTSSGAYATGARSSSEVYSETTPEAASSKPYEASYTVSFSALYPSEVSSAEPPVYSTATYSASKGMDYPAESSKGHGEYPASSTGHNSMPPVTKKPEQSAYPSVPAGSTTNVVTTTYVDVCPTGLTTVTTTYVETVCTKCAKPTGATDVPERWTTSVYTASTITVTVTKPIATATDVPAHPSSAPSVAYPADYSSSPIPSGKPAYPTVAEASKPAYPVIPQSSKMAEYPVVPEASKMPEYPAAPTSSKMAEYPVAPEASKMPEYPAAPQSSNMADYPSTPSVAHPASSSPATPEYPSHPIGNDYPKKPVEHADITSTISMTLTKVPVPAYTPAPYVPVGPAKNATSAYAPMPTGTGKPTMPSSYAPPEFEGAASRASVGLAMLVGVVGAILVV